MFKKDKLSLALIFLIFSFIVFGVYSNILEQKAIDNSKLPEKVEDHHLFQRWITNLKNKGIEVGADDFRIIEENEIYNTKWMSIYSVDNEEMYSKYQNTLEELQHTFEVVFSPSERLLIDFRNMYREGYQANEIRFYGQKEDKIIDARILDCSVRANCYFDRAYFLSNDLFVITEFSRTIDKHDEETPLCDIKDTCTYSIKLHLVDLINNKRLVYESNSFETVLEDLIPQL